MKRYLRPLLLGLLGVLTTTFLGALVNIWTATIPQNHPLVAYAPLLIGALLCAVVALYAWQYVAEHRAEADSAPLPDSPRGLMIANVRATWITGVLEKSLYREVQLQPGLRSDPRKVNLPIRALVQEAGGQAEDLPDGIPIAQIFDRFGGALLILGEPGAGKTTLLLELCRTLLDRAEHDLSLPMPIVFPLSTWISGRRLLTEWLVDQLVTLYQVQRKVAVTWVAENRVLPLLDGLDEVDEDERPGCVQAINTFRAERGTLPLVVCSRLREYETVAHEATHLRLQGAVIVQTLRRAVVLEALVNLGPEAADLHVLLAADPHNWLWSVATSPLGLSVLVPAVLNDPALLQTPGSDDKRRDRIFGAYVNAMFERRAAEARWSREETIRLLSWLAVQMQERGLTLFLLESLQRKWLPNRWEQRIVFWSIMVIGEISIFLVIWLSCWQFGVICGQLTKALPAGAGVGFLFGMCFWGFHYLTSGGVLRNFRISQYPNQGIIEPARQTFAASLVGGFIGGVLIGIFDYLIVHSPSSLIQGIVGGLLGGILSSFLSFAGYDVIQHCTLRLLLARAGLAPLRYGAFLDHAADRVLLRRVGGGWVFVHRLLLDYFASLAPGPGMVSEGEGER
jgi:fluoride ion exporter CrcB/FEX